MKIEIGLLVLSVTSFGLAACTEVDSEDVLTSGMYARFRAEVQDNGTLVSANLNVGGSASNATNVELSGDDKLVANMGDMEKEMQKNLEIIDINDPHYSAFFTNETDAGAEVKVAFLRSVDDGAPESTVSLPTVSSASAPTGTQSRASAAIEVTFLAADADENTVVTISGDCFQTATQEVSGGAATSITFAAGSLLEPEPADGEEPVAPASCEANVHVERVRLGAVDEGFGEGGVFHGVRAETLNFTSAP